jgi:hypothetical protein
MHAKKQIWNTFTNSNDTSTAVLLVLEGETVRSFDVTIVSIPIFGQQFANKSIIKSFFLTLSLAIRITQIL